MEILNNVLPWVVLGILIYFTMILISYPYGLYKAKKMDPSLKLAASKTGKIFFAVLYTVYFIVLIYTCYLEFNVFTSNVKGKIKLALNNINLLTLLTFIAAIEIQDIFFIGQKNMLLGDRMFEIRRMRKMTFPKRRTVSFYYGQKEYKYSVRFADVTAFKSKFTKMR